MVMTDEQYKKMIDERMERAAKLAFRCFTGPEHKYQVAIQDDDYMDVRGDYVALTFSTILDEKKAKGVVVRDYKEFKRRGG